MFLFILALLFVTTGQSKAQNCVGGNSTGVVSLPIFTDPGRDGPRIETNPIQVIIKSYQFHCCGKVGGWSAYVEPGGSMHTVGVYSVKFQIWRPSDNNRYVKIGENSFPSVTFVAESVINETPNVTEQLNFQPGDVVGYYLEDNEDQNGGVQFDSNFDLEELWYVTGNSALQDECLLEVGSAGDLSMSTTLGPLISISLTTTVNDNCPSTFTSTMFCPTPTMIPGTPVTVADCLQATNGARNLPNFVKPGGRNPAQFDFNPIQAIIPSYQFTCAGEITEWRAFVDGSGPGHFESQPYAISFQVWRPNSTSSSYIMIGFNHFSPIPLADDVSNDRGIVTGVPPESERIEVQPGDVVGFYLESSQDSNDGIQFARDSDNDPSYTGETVWFDGARCSMLDPPCVYSVGDFISMTNRAPLITVTVVSTPIIPSSALMPQVPSSTPLNIVNAATSSIFSSPPVPFSTLPIKIPPSSTPSPAVMPPVNISPPAVVPPVNTPPPPVTPSVLVPTVLCNSCPRILPSVVTTSHQPTPTLIVTPTQPSAAINLGLYVGVSVGLLVLVLLTVTLVGLACMGLIRKKRNIKAQREYVIRYTNALINDCKTDTSPGPSSNNTLYNNASYEMISDLRTQVPVVYDYATTNPLFIKSELSTSPVYKNVGTAEEDIVEQTCNKEKTMLSKGHLRLEVAPDTENSVEYATIEAESSLNSGSSIPTKENQAYISVDNELETSYDYLY